MKKTRIFAFGVVIALGLAFGAGLYTGISERNSSTVSAAEVPTVTIDLGNSQPKNVDFAQFWKAWNILNQNFVQTHASDTMPTDQEKIYGAIAGLTRWLRKNSSYRHTKERWNATVTHSTSSSTSLLCAVVTANQNKK